LCRFHHRLKTYGGWQARSTRTDEPYPAGTVEWTSRLGLKHYSPPPVIPGSNGWKPPPATSGAPIAPTALEPARIPPPDHTTAAERRTECRRTWRRQVEHVTRRDRSNRPGSQPVDRPGSQPVDRPGNQPCTPEIDADNGSAASFSTAPNSANLGVVQRRKRRLDSSGEPPF
jgi:hypothetical protein